MSKEYNGGKAGFWIGLAIREGLPALGALFTLIWSSVRAGRKVEAKDNATTGNAQTAQSVEQ